MARTSKHKAKTEDTRAGITHPPKRTKRRTPAPKAPKKVCHECGQLASFVDVSDYKPENEQIHELRGISEMNRSLLMMGRIQDDLRKQKHKEFDMHEVDTKRWALCPAKDGVTWTNAIMVKLAKTIAPFAHSSKETWHIHPKKLPHPKKKKSRGGSL